MTIPEYTSLQLGVIGIIIALMALLGGWFFRRLRQELSDSISKIIQPVQAVARDLTEIKDDIKQVKANSYEAKTQLTQANQQLSKAVQLLTENHVGQERLMVQHQGLEKQLEKMEWDLKTCRQK